jgi:hypothetical protein
VRSPTHPWELVDHEERRCATCGLVQVVKAVKIPGSPRGKKTVQTWWVTPEGHVQHGGIAPLCVPFERKHPKE